MYADTVAYSPGLERMVSVSFHKHPHFLYCVIGNIMSKPERLFTSGYIKKGSREQCAYVMCVCG